MELVLIGIPFRTSEASIYVMKGDVDKYQAIFGNQEYADANPIESDQRSNFVLIPLNQTAEINALIYCSCTLPLEPVGFELLLDPCD
ncbi:hypothetical protein ES703_51230 [subsurface metagenome]